jgi:hypothetical protein
MVQRPGAVTDMKTKPSATRRDIVTLSDLVPRQDVKGGARKRVFGVSASPRPTREASDRPPPPRKEPR